LHESHESNGVVYSEVVSKPHLEQFDKITGVEMHAGDIVWAGRRLCKRFEYERHDIALGSFKVELTICANP
jgi:hypothetical protein